MIGRRGFVTGLAALVAAPAIIRVAPLMPISVRHQPLYVPASWLAEYLAKNDKGLSDLRRHAWSRPMADNWININDYDPGFVKAWSFDVADGGEYLFS